MQKLSASLDLQTPSPQGGFSAPCPSPGLPSNEPDLHSALNKFHTFVDQNFGAGQRPVLLGDPPAQAPALLPPPPPPGPGPHRARGAHSPRGVRRELPEREFPLQRRPRKRSKKGDRVKKDRVKKQVLKFHTRYLEPRDYRSHGDPPGICAPLVPCTDGPSNHRISSVLIKQFVQNQW